MSGNDHDVGHITPADANIFAELGFAQKEADALLAETQAEIEKISRLKEQLMTELSDWISQSHLKQSEAAERLRVSRPRVSDVVNKKVGKFTLDTLIEMLQRIGKNVQIAVN
ncbi:MAG: family transcriptional regulator [Rhizobium sp.]|nr:family transcriptional regulator [Rhizobium sp.]